jgi:hypothetical protein
MNGALKRFVATAALVLPALGACSGAGRGVSVSSEDYAVPYDYGEFRAATDGKDFPVLIAGNPFPDLSVADLDRRLLPVMQAHKPRPRLTFTLDTVPAARVERPAYRLVLVFDAANDVTAGRVCKGETRFAAHVPGRIAMFAVYCRNDLPMSQAIGRTTATRPEDPAVAQLFGDVFQTLFTEAPINQHDQGYPGGLQ